MAGDWIKIEHATPDKPELAMLANLLCIDRRECMGLLFDFWVWWDRNAGDDLVVRMLSGNCPDSVSPLTAKSLDDIMRCPGFSAAMGVVGWVEIDELRGTVTLPNCGEHNGKTAKNRALDNRRKAESRATGQTADRNRTKEEKRREEQIHTPKPPRRQAGTSLPNPFSISDRVRRWAVAKGFDRLEARLEHFVGYVRAHDKHYVDWDEALMQAIRGDWAKLPPIVGADARKVAI